MDRLRCNRCRADKLRSEFSPWALAKSTRVCRSCTNAKNREAVALKRSSLDRVLMAKLRRLMHKDGASRSFTLRLQLQAMRRLIKRCGARSVFSGIGSADRLTVVHWDRTRRVDLDNVVLCTHAEAREHNRHRLSDYHPKFVEHVSSELMLQTHDSQGHPDSDPDSDSDSAVDQPRYPPISSYKRGVDPKVVTWFVHQFGAVHPRDCGGARSDRVLGRFSSAESARVSVN